MSKESITFLIIIAAFILVLFLLGLRERKRREAALKKHIKASYGHKASAKISSERYDELLLISEAHYNAHKEGASYVDDISFSDLDMKKVFAEADSAFSPAGEESLYTALREPLYDDHIIEERRKEADYYDEHEELREAFSFLIAKTAHFSKASNISEGSDKTPSLKMHLAAPLIIIISFILIFIDTRAGIAAFIISIVINVSWYFFSKPKLLAYTDALNTVISETNAANECLKSRSRIWKNAPSSIDEKLNKLEQYSNELSGFKKAAAFVVAATSDKASPFSVLGDYFNMLFHLDIIVFSFLADKLNKSRESASALHRIMGELELPLIIASYRRSFEKVCIPVCDNEESAKGIYHPLLAKPVKNDYSLSKGLLLTGSNASGKSTFLKTVGLNMIFARTLGFACADEFHSGMKKIYTSMALRDDITAGESYFYTEIKAMKRILDGAENEHKTVCIADELLKGTNTTERVAASSELLRFMSGSGIMTFAATHDLELVSILDGVYDFRHFEENVEGKDVRFNYLLKDGPSKTKNAILLLKGMGYDERIVKAAGERADMFLKNGSWI